MELLTPEIEAPRLMRAGIWKTLAEAHEQALVIVAMGMDCSVHPVEGGYEIWTAAEDLGRAQRELALYAAEQVPPVIGEETPDHPLGIVWLLGWAAVLAGIFDRQLEQPGLTERFSNSSRGLMEAGEWWRPFTSLFLHADLLHLWGNLLIGGLFCIGVAKSIGAWRAWLLILLGDTAGNAINAALHRSGDFQAIGASAATFAALGILVGLGVAESARCGSCRRLRPLAVPLVAGFLLFSLFGTAGERTDIGGHAWGGLCGLAIGISAKWLKFGNRPPSPLPPLAAIVPQPVGRGSRPG